MSRFTVHHGDCLAIMPTLPEASVDSIVTDPPYGLSFMGKDWDHGVPGVAFWREALRVAKPGAFLLAFGGTRTFHRLTCAIEDAGWEVRDCIMWVYGSGFPKSHNIKGAWQGWGTALKPAWEPIIVARRPLCGTVADNVLRYGTGAMNVDGCRVGTTKDVPASPKCVGASQHTVSMPGGSRDDSGLNPNIGRWPANLIHDGSEEVLARFPETTSGTLKGQYSGGGGSGIYSKFGVDDKDFEANTGSASRFFYCAKASKRDRDEGCEGLSLKAVHRYGAGIGEGLDPSAPALDRNHHPTVKPTDLMRYLCRLVTQPGGTVLDPFTGSGSTGKAAMLEGLNFIGCELSEEYVKIAEARICNAIAKSVPTDLFGEKEYKC